MAYMLRIASAHHEPIMQSAPTPHSHLPTHTNAPLGLPFTPPYHAFTHPTTHQEHR